MGHESWEELLIVYNASPDDYRMRVPEGSWEVLADGKAADCRRMIEEGVREVPVEGRSGMLLAR